MFFKRRSKSKELAVIQPEPSSATITGKKLPARKINYAFDMDTPLLQLSPHPDDAWMLRDAFEGVQIFGGTGSGKTSGSGRALAHAYLQAGMGGIVLCAKPDEADNWEHYAKETGRSRSIIRFDASGRYRFNFLEYEMSRNPEAADIMSGNVVNALQNVLEIAARGTSLSTPSAGDAFWQKAPKTILGHTIDILYATTGRLRLSEIMDFIESAPTSTEQMADPAWRKGSFFHKVFEEFYATGGGRFPPDIEDSRRLFSFWRKNYPNMAEKTRSNIITTLTADLDPLLRGRMRKIFCGETNIVPEMTHEGAIILLDFPIKQWNEAGILAQQIFKYLWQRATERRNPDEHSRPVFMWSDECQFFLSGYDMEFQSTARSSRACTVLMSQNLPTFFSKIGGQVPEHTVNALIGNLRTKILHANTDNVTNKWATEMIGRETVWRETHGRNESSSEGRSNNWSEGDNWGTSSSYTRNTEGPGGGITSGSNWGLNDGRGVTVQGNYSEGESYSVAEHRDNAIDPEDFGRDLQTGGKRNGYQVSGVIVQGGRRFACNRKNWLHVYFDQR